MIDYDKALKIIEKFNIESGLRDFCTNRCGGACCWDCKDRCIKYKERRLACSTYFCASIMDIIFVNSKKRSKYNSIHRDLVSHLGKFIKSRPLYYKHLDKKEEANIRKEGIVDSVKELESIDTAEIREIVKGISDKQIDGIRFREETLAQEALEKRRMTRAKKKKDEGV